MGVTTSKYLGYVVDIQKEWDKLLDEQQDFWSLSKENDTETFKPYYVTGNPEGRITIVYDGMNGEYTKLIYVIAYCRGVSDDDEKMVEKINENLADAVVPMDVRYKLREIYKQIFKVDHITDFEVHMEYFIHWS